MSRRKTYRVGAIGFAHMHINNVLALFGKHPQVRLVACADTAAARPELRKGPYTREWNVEFALHEIGVPRAYADYREMLAKEKFDIIVCCAENARHPEVVEACATAGVHVCVEKPMAMSLEHGLRMARAARAAGTRLVVNWPMTWSGAARKAGQLIQAGAVGRVIEVKWRGGHTGPLGPGAEHQGVAEKAKMLTGTQLGATWWHHAADGGGAMLDYCCYGAMVSFWYIGERGLAAVGLKGNLASPWGDADDNGAMIVRFPSAMGLYEGSWTTWSQGVPNGPIVYGTTGVLVVDEKANVVREEHGSGGRDRVHKPAPLPKGRHNVAHEFIHHLDTGDAIHPTLDLDFNLDVMAILDAGLKSAESGRMETVDSASWRVG
ncbi:MAG: Gfo/Idh/MocA family oxidoreductase [Planctomycetes bacterium]|nr:Gfo/Idh/MocA family oxidoreductase [Planctomycetota bacterium]